LYPATTTIQNQSYSFSAVQEYSERRVSNNGTFLGPLTNQSNFQLHRSLRQYTSQGTAQEQNPFQPDQIASLNLNRSVGLMPRSEAAMTRRDQNIGIYF